MIIEQSKEQLQQAIALHTKVYMRFLRLSQSRVWSRPRSSSALDEIKDLNFDIKFSPGGARSADDCLTLDTDFTFAIGEQSAAEDQREPIVVIECRFEAQYSLSGNYRPSEPEIEAFRSANAIFNCWPYFREYVQNTTVRMNFPPPAIPLLRLMRKQETESPTETSHAASTPRKRAATRKRPILQKKEL